MKTDGIRTCALDIAARPKKRTAIFIKCEACGRTFSTNPSRLKRGRRHFCNIDCYNRAKKQNGNPKWKGGPFIGHCQICGGAYASQFPSQKYCSVKCAQKGLIKKPLSVEKAVEIIAEFRKSGLAVAAFCKRSGFSESYFRKRIGRIAPDDFARATEASHLQWNEVYRRGRNFEYAVRRELTSSGYVCMVSPGSMGPADLLAVKAGRIFLIQCKISDGSLRRSEKNALLKLANEAGGAPILAIKNGEGVTFFELFLHRPKIKVAL